MRWVAVGLGALLALMGGLWALQGVGLVGGSPMTGQPFWIWAGLVTAVAGLVLAYTAWRRGVPASKRPAGSSDGRTRHG